MDFNVFMRLNLFLTAFTVFSTSSLFLQSLSDFSARSTKERELTAPSSVTNVAALPAAESYECQPVTSSLLISEDGPEIAQKNSESFRQQIAAVSISRPNTKTRQ